MRTNHSKQDLLNLKQKKQKLKLRKRSKRKLKLSRKESMRKSSLKNKVLLMPINPKRMSGGKGPLPSKQWWM
jgi:hypothetical protein|nr:MAG TPA: hypothetical protein [Caudoviricetes sp.]